MECGGDNEKEDENEEDDMEDDEKEKDADEEEDDDEDDGKEHQTSCPGELVNTLANDVDITVDYKRIVSPDCDREVCKHAP
jgi:cobalamin biosynthesis protein CobT